MICALQAINTRYTWTCTPVYGFVSSTRLASHFPAQFAHREDSLHCGNAQTNISNHNNSMAKSTPAPLLLWYRYQKHHKRLASQNPTHHHLCSHPPLLTLPFSLSFPLSLSCCCTLSPSFPFSLLTLPLLTGTYLSLKFITTAKNRISPSG